MNGDCGHEVRAKLVGSLALMLRARRPRCYRMSRTSDVVDTLAP